MLANPPYGLLNKRQNQQMGHVMSDALIAQIRSSTEYAPVLRGMVNVCQLFIRRSLTLTRKSGLVVEIFPLSFACDWSFGPLRRHIFEKHTLRRLEAFPERDNPNRRVFESAKMSVAIAVIERTEPISESSFEFRINWGPQIDMGAEEVVLSGADVRRFDSNYSIPLVGSSDLAFLRKVYGGSVRLEEIGRCGTGEVDLTLCRRFINSNPRNATLYKGAIIGRYQIRRSMSQGEIEYLDKRAFLAAKGKKATSAAWHHQHDRIVLQGITGINEDIRLKMTLIPPGSFCANSANYILLNEPEIGEYLFILGVLNSSAANRVFKCFSTNSNVNGYEVDNLPVPPASSAQKSAIAELARKCLEAEGVNCEEWDREIDQRVMALYGL